MLLSLLTYFSRFSYYSKQEHLTASIFPVYIGMFLLTLSTALKLFLCSFLWSFHIFSQHPFVKGNIRVHSRQ